VILEWVIGIAELVASWFLGIIPSFADGQLEVVVSATNIVTPFIVGIYQLGAWLPWAQLAIMMPLVLTTYTVSLFARALRAVLGHIPLIGGNG
jgi:hypothetical protein